MSYFAHSEEEFTEIKEWIEGLTEINDSLPSWPMQFVSDMRQRLAKHGRNISLSDSQKSKLEEIYAQYVEAAKEDKQMDTKDMFDELENRDKGRRFR